MSIDANSDLDGPTTVSEEDVTVEKSFVADDFPVPVVEFVVRSSADTPVDVRLTEELPESFPMDRVGFHPNYDGDSWTAYGDHRVEYERTVEPGETIETVYGIRIDDPSEATEFLGRPGLDVAGTDEVSVSVEPADEVLGRDTTRAVRDALTGEEDPDAPDGTAVDGAELDMPEDDDPAASSRGDVDGVRTDADAGGGIDLADPTAGGEDTDPDGPAGGVGGGTALGMDGSDGDGGGIDLAGPTAEVESAELDDPTGEDTDTDVADAVAHGDGGTALGANGGASGPSRTGTETVVSALAAEIRAGDVDASDLDLLREELGPAVDDGVPTSVEVRLERLQSRTDDLAAYTDALAEFLDEEGTGRELIEGFREDISAVGEDLDAVEAELEDASEHRSALTDEVEGLTARQASLSAATYGIAAGQADVVAETDDLGTRVDEAAAGLAATTDRVELLDEEVGTVRSDVSDLESAVASLADDLSALRTTVEDVEADVEAVTSLEDDLSALRESVDGIRGDLDAVEAVENELADLRETVEGVEEDIDTLMQFRERVNRAFGPSE